MIYLHLIFSYLKIGLFGFGGGYAMLALIEREIVGSGWITGRTFTDIVAVSQMTPGPIGINSATYIGYVAPLDAGFSSPLWGVLGSAICTAAVVVPSFCLLIYTSRLIARRRDSAAVRGMFRGLRLVVPGLIASAALLLVNAANFGSAPGDVAWSAALCLGAFAAVFFFKVHPILVVCAAGAAGFFIF